MGPTEGARGGTAGGDITARGRPGVKDVGLRFPEMNTSEEIFKLTRQMKSKSCNLYVNGKLRTRGIQINKNDRLLIFKLNVIDPESQHLTSDER